MALVVLSNREVRERLRRDEKGEVTEKVIITALFAALALTAATIITIKVTERAESIPTEVPAQQGGGLGG
ncbi:MAG: hypothetical protein KY447_09100 [Actinobacteria bacterium]|nr:hypothetical protein [Actinomycetota bacterium]